MDFPLKKDLVFLDLEATGLHVVRDRIVQIALIKYKAGSESEPPEELVRTINPGIPISAEAMAVHGITPEDVRNKPTFRELADELYAFIGDADLAGYNSNRYDVPMLMEEFARVGMEFNLKGRRLIDVQRIFYKMEPRTLRAALRYYCGQELEDAHDALADVRATIDVFKGQLERYEDEPWIDEDGVEHTSPIVKDIQALHDFTNDLRFADATQRMRYDENGVVVFNFGKYNGRPVAETLVRDKQYYHWILDKDFSAEVKQLVRELVKAYEDK